MTTSQSSQSHKLRSCMADKRSEIIAKAWKDPTFKKKLLSNPAEALKECGINLPANTKVKVIEDQPGTYTFVLPASPSNVNTVSETELEKIAGGMCCNMTPMTQ